MKKTLIAGAFAALLVSVTWAQDASSDFDSLAGTADSTSTSAVSWGKFTWSTEQDATASVSTESDTKTVDGSLDSSITGQYSIGDFKVFGSASASHNEFVPGETYLQWAPGNFKVAAGLMEFSWGVADANNPTDTLNARDYRWGAKADRIANPASLVAWYPADWISVEAVYEPWKEASKFPTDFAATLESEFGANVTVTEDDHNGSKPVFGGRMNFFLPGIDLAASYVYDRDPYYTAIIKSVSTSTYKPSEIELVHRGIQRIGINAKTTVDKFGVWFEGAYNITEDPFATDDTIRDNKLTWTTGFDFNWGPGSAYYVNIQYAGSFIPTYNSAHVTYSSYAELLDGSYYYRMITDSLGSDTEQWMHGATYSLKFPLADNTITPTLSGAFMVPVGYDSTDQTRLLSAYFNPEIDMAPVDGIHVFLGANMAYGWVKKAGSDSITLDQTTDKLGIYTPQNNVYLTVQYKWNGSFGE